MNSAVAPSSRFACRVTRGWISVFGNESSALRSAHVASCPDCQAFFSAGDELESALRRDAAAERALPPESLEADILRTVHASARPARRSFMLPVFSLCGVAAAIAAAIMVMQPSTGPQASPEEIKGAKFAVDSIPDNLFAELRPQAQAILNQDPLQNELDAVVSNARSAVHFLARNFLPSDAPLALQGRNSG
jgi:hypothetical protein